MSTLIDVTRKGEEITLTFNEGTVVLGLDRDEARQLGAALIEAAGPIPEYAEDDSALLVDDGEQQSN